MVEFYGEKMETTWYWSFKISLKTILTLPYTSQFDVPPAYIYRSWNKDKTTGHLYTMNITQPLFLSWLICNFTRAKLAGLSIDNLKLTDNDG